MKYYFLVFIQSIKDILGWIKLSMRPTKLDISIDNQKRFRISLGNFVMVGIEQFRQNEIIELKIKFAEKSGIERFEHLCLEKFNKEYFQKNNPDVQMEARTIVAPKNESLVVIHNSDTEIEQRMKNEIEQLKGIILSLQSRNDPQNERVH